MSAYAPGTRILGELSMNRTLIALLITMLAFGVYAQEEVTPTYLCISDARIGFDWENGQWVQKRYAEQKYLIKKDFVWSSAIEEPTEPIWAVYYFGSKSPSYWSEQEFRFEMIDYITGYTTFT